MQDTLLIELLTEELPPKSLSRLSEAFASAIFTALKDQDFLSDTSRYSAYATPRRLAVSITVVAIVQPDKQIERKGPLAASARDAAGKPTTALLGFAKSCGVDVNALELGLDAKGVSCYVYKFKKTGQELRDVLIKILSEVLSKLPVAKVMRWGDGEEQFVRPVHSFFVLYGNQELCAHQKLLGVEGVFGITRGHRFLSSGPVKISHADQYESTLETEGRVIPSFTKRKQRILNELQAQAKGANIIWDEELLDEVTALVEYPVVYAGGFSPDFLSIPQECLILSMKHHQRYFPLADEQGSLLPRFLMVSNLETDNPQNIIHGNERVLRARLSDAKFFYDQDRKTRLEERVPKLAKVVYHNKLGSQLERVERIQKLAGAIAASLGADAALAERAGYLCKADLLTEMVGEFPELQGITGRYYAFHDGEPQDVAYAIESHYLPRFAGDGLPQGGVCLSVALADKLETLAGLFGIGQQPTGDKDPFALRRQALGVIRILVEGGLSLSLDKLVKEAFSAFPEGMLGDAHTDLEIFILERLRGYLRDAGYSANEVESVLRMSPRLDLIPRRLAAVRAFIDLPEAQSLSTANKRVVNILKQAEAKGESFINAEADLLKEPAERALFDALRKTSEQAASLFRQGDFTGYLKTFAVLKSPVDAFFDSVMVMVDDPALRQNRLALLADLRKEMNQVADISKLAA